MMVKIKELNGSEEKQLYTGALLGLNGLNGILTPDQYSVLVPQNIEFLLSISFTDNGSVIVFAVTDSILDGKNLPAYNARIPTAGQHMWSVGHVCFQLTVS